MKRVFISIITFLFFTSAFAQADLQQIYDTQSAFDRALAEKGAKAAFLEFIADDSIVFRPNATRGREFWTTSKDSPGELLVRTLTFSDIASNGLLGYTTGNWRCYPKGESESAADFGQYATIWEKKADGKFRAVVDIDIEHEKLPFTETDQTQRTEKRKDLNKRGWSPADASMNFLRMSMSASRLGGAYAKFAARDVRLLVEGQPPILGRKRVVSETKRYISIDFPKTVAMHQSADMAYFWNPCEFANSNEGIEKGNCLHIWKLRNKKWWIVLGVFSRVPNETQPTLKTKSSR